MANIRVSSKDGNPWEFEVEISENSSLSRHKVTIDQNFYKSFKTEFSPEEFIYKSIEFLLERESPDAVLKEFEVSKIADYFDDYIGVMRERLSTPLG
ncbi:hypothetical protein C4553_00360 [Candidatus Parcubacteria bacterium]|nr:MAG: hypothetical protein C4553_00360 [Candidatus Parcubacteria bacterium]